MKRTTCVLAASLIAIAGAGIMPASADPLRDTVNGVGDTLTRTVDGLADGVGDLTGTGGAGRGTNVGDVVSLNAPRDNALVDVDVGDGRDLLRARLGGEDPLAAARVGTRGLLDSTTVRLDVGGLGLDTTLDLGIVGPGAPDGPGNPQAPGGPILVGALGGGDTFTITCAVDNSRQLLELAASGAVGDAEVRAWQRVSNVQVVPIRLCPDARREVAQILARSDKVERLHRAVAADQLVMASLGRSSHDVDDVVAVHRQQGQLVVYVY